ncbi:circumsporozoite protein-like [Heteronotia binoei]|uniref:circumsporozoite protein-like n=1 Tax=Heteronotia binoei TaxID=13085 RepID=UPI00292FF373|nr:circumsporozoite protein-like [Heteronotia binoei]
MRSLQPPCDQDPSHRHNCGGEAEKFYPHQCLQKKCCYMNHTCYHHIIDGGIQRRNAGILGGTCVVVIIFCACLFYGCKFREFQRKERLSEGPASEGNIDDYLVRLLDDESMAGSEPQEGTVSLQEDDSWTQRRASKQVAWSPEPVELEELRIQRQWTPEPSPEISLGPSPEPPPLSPEPPPPPAPEGPPPPPSDAPPPPTPDAPPPPTPDAPPPPAPDEPPPPAPDAPPPPAPDEPPPP